MDKLESCSAKLVAYGHFCVNIYGVAMKYFVIIAFGLLSSCKLGKSCMQPAEARWKLINETGQTQNVVLQLYANGAEQANQSIMLPPNSTTDSLMLSYEYEETPYYHGKLDLDPEDATCTAEPKVQSSSIQLLDPSSNLKICFVENEYTAHFVYLADPCPANTHELKRWE